MMVRMGWAMMLEITTTTAAFLIHKPEDGEVGISRDEGAELVVRDGSEKVRVLCGSEKWI